jgi:hypothetical protein
MTSPTATSFIDGALRPFGGGLRSFALERDSQAGANSSLGVVTVRDGRAEDRHDGVADELLQDAAVLLDPGFRFAVVELEHIADVLGVGLVRTCGRIDEVDEQDGHELALLLRRRGLAERGPAPAAEARPGGLALPQLAHTTSTTVIA